ncbi:MAG TPA: hypothetical protein VKR58_11775, partial [Aquella sp.]|nr:hypothetical protein [Aquella sp.]
MPHLSVILIYCGLHLLAFLSLVQIVNIFVRNEMKKLIITSVVYTLLTNFAQAIECPNIPAGHPFNTPIFENGHEWHIIDINNDPGLPNYVSHHYGFVIQPNLPHSIPPVPYIVWGTHSDKK